MKYSERKISQCILPLRNSIFNFSLKVVKKLLSVIFKFNMVSVWHLPSRTVFYRFYDVICRHHIVSGTREELKLIYFFLLKRCYLLERKRLHRFKSQLLNSPNFQPGQLLSSCLGIDLNLSLSLKQLSCL